MLAWADAGPEVVEPQVSRLCMEAEEFIANGELIFSKITEKDVESIFTIICNLITENPDVVMDIIKVISAKLIQQPREKPAVCLKILINLYNLVETPYYRFYIYMKALNLAAEGKVTKYIIPSLKNIDNFLKDRKKDAHVLSEAKEEAVHAIIDFVKLSYIFQCDLLDMPAVLQLEKDAKYAVLYQLLKIFLTQRLGAYLEYHTTNSDLEKNYGLVHAKMRLMSLVDLSSNGSCRIRYELIREILNINDDEVELWVVKAITAKLIDCKMDQMNQVVVVSHHTYGMFGQHQWQALRTKLMTWRDNISNVINTIQANKVTEDGSQAVQGLVVR
ncbi:hypothetical protein AAHE18_20G178500 [Arachis hypogaea]